MADTSYAVPVYRGWPERDYQVLGSLSFPDPNKYWDDGVVSAVASAAKAHHAEAIIIRQGAEFGVSAIAGTQPTDFNVLSYSAQTTALAIRWLTTQEIKDRELLLNDLLGRFSISDPRVVANREIGELVAIYLIQSGSNPKSPEFADRFAELMHKMVAESPEKVAGTWIFKESIETGTALSQGAEQTRLGIAAATTDGNDITIVSTGGLSELNFTGVFEKGKVTGQLGLDTLSSKCDGALTGDKISISFQSLTQDGTIRGNVVLQRLLVNPKGTDDEKAKPDSTSRLRG